MKVYLDITGFIDAPYMTGIQRVVREVSVRLLKEKEISLILLYCPNRLGHFFNVIDNDKYLKIVNDKKKKQCVTNKKIALYEIERDSVFYDVDATWMTSINRSVLLPILKENGVKIVTHVHDIIVLNDPSFGYQRTIFSFMNFVVAQFIYADVIMTCSESNVDDFIKFANTLGLGYPKYQVVPCGSDFFVETKEEEIDQHAKQIVNNGKYIMMVSTIEPRKNQKLLFEAYKEAFEEMNMQLVLVGREGWNVHDFIEEMHSYSGYGTTLHHLSGINDETLNYLYDNAYLVAFTSYNEGFGLPIVEGIKHGKIVIASDVKVLKEVGGDYCEYFQVDDVQDFIRVIKKYNDNLDLYNDKNDKVKKYIPYTWDDAAAVITSTLLTCESTVARATPMKLNQRRIENIDYRVEAWGRKYQIDYGCFPNIIMKNNSGVLQVSPPKQYYLLRGKENVVSISLVDVGCVEINCFVVTKDGFGISNIAYGTTTEEDRTVDLAVQVDSLEKNADLFVLFRKKDSVSTSICRIDAIIE